MTLVGAPLLTAGSVASWAFDFKSNTDSKFKLTYVNDSNYTANLLKDSLFFSGITSGQEIDFSPVDLWTVKVTANHQVAAASGNALNSSNTFTWTINSPAPVPEPSTWVLLGGAFAGLATYRGVRRRLRHRLADAPLST